LRRFRYLRRVRNHRIPKIILKWNTEDRGRKEKPKEQWMDGVRSMISKDSAEEDAGIR
jgi:hypothetical protein